MGGVTATAAFRQTAFPDFLLSGLAKKRIISRSMACFFNHDNEPEGDVMPDQRWFQIMTNLLYPAVLGSLIYTFAESAVPGAQLDDPLLWGGFSLLALFVFDYAHSSREEVRATYDGWKFLADLLIVSFLFLAGKAVLKSPVLPGIDYVWWLFFAKLAAVIWEFIESRRAQPSQAGSAASRKLANAFGIETDLALCVIYLVIGWLAFVEVQWWTWAVAVAMAFDAVQYYRFARQPAANGVT